MLFVIDISAITLVNIRSLVEENIGVKMNSRESAMPMARCVIYAPQMQHFSV